MGIEIVDPSPACPDPDQAGPVFVQGPYAVVAEAGRVCRVMPEMVDDQVCPGIDLIQSLSPPGPKIAAAGLKDGRDRSFPGMLCTGTGQDRVTGSCGDIESVQP